MNDMRKWTAVFLAIFGLYLLVGVFSSFITLISIFVGYISHGMLLNKNILTPLANVLVSLGFAVAVYIIFIKKRESLAAFLVDREIASESKDVPSGIWLPFLYRMVCQVAGFLILYDCVVTCLNGFIQYFLTQSQENDLLQMQGRNPLPWLVLIPIGIYLLCGAPHFVRWHVKKTLELASEPPATKPIPSETGSKGEDNGIV